MKEVQLAEATTVVVAEMVGEEDLRATGHSVNYVVNLVILCILAITDMILTSKDSPNRIQTKSHTQNTLPPSPASTFHQPKSYLTAAPNPSDSSWFADSRASHHVTAEQSNILQHNESNQGLEQLYVANGKGVTRAMLLKGNTKGGLYFFDNLVVPKPESNHHTTQGSIERKHRHITETGLSLLATASMPLRVWDATFTSAEAPPSSPQQTQPNQVQLAPTTIEPSTTAPVSISSIEIVLPVSTDQGTSP
ncbi:hypothetical protein PIB30_032143 [Stylosanthes scabra]|uniref:Uncharacterized protein n=1 Tax=Stylosanthes scabra TaxID=79078 RepID=A0ABU6XCA7_9FABA|nr:hypothetical protein [Stylosanthes scabra]